MSPSTFPRVPALLMAAAAVTSLFATPHEADAQGLKIAFRDYGVGIGPVPRVNGVRINFRDDGRFERVNGINATLWSPLTERRWADGGRREPVRGTVNGR